ncbi:MAG: hypothetical protein LUG93_19400 [Lachnospiraceae bacterium]|nr:hypothetical protein [Lachnospiraceae bacterium]
MKCEIGYIVEYSEKNGVFGECGERKKAFATREQLIKMLERQFTYAIWAAHWTNYAEYRVNVGSLPCISL